MLLGYRISPTVVEVHKWKHPKLQTSTPSEVSPHKESFVRCINYARQHGMIVVGDIHSHINQDVVMSPQDFKDHYDKNYCITGILSINKNNVTIAFWELNSPLPATVQYLK